MIYECIERVCSLWRVLGIAICSGRAAKRKTDYIHYYIINSIRKLNEHRPKQKKTSSRSKLVDANNILSHDRESPYSLSCCWNWSNFFSVSSYIFWSASMTHGASKSNWKFFTKQKRRTLDKWDKKINACVILMRIVINEKWVHRSIAEKFSIFVRHRSIQIWNVNRFLAGKNWKFATHTWNEFTSHISPTQRNRFYLNLCRIRRKLCSNPFWWSSNQNRNKRRRCERIETKGRTKKTNQIQEKNWGKKCWKKWTKCIDQFWTTLQQRQKGK